MKMFSETGYREDSELGPRVPEDEIKHLPREKDLPTIPKEKFPKFPETEKRYNNALERVGLLKRGDAASVMPDVGGNNPNRKWREHLETGEDGRFYDKDTHKSYPTVDDWVTAKKREAESYSVKAEYFKKQANAAAERYDNAVECGASDAEKRKYYQDYNDYSDKAKEYENKAEKTNEIARDVDEDNHDPIKNKQEGLEREKEVYEDLKKQYPESEGYKIISEAYLRDENGNIVKDPETGEARRIDYVVVKDGKVVDSIEVTSQTADKTKQTAKKNRIREAGGNYIRDNDGNLVEIPADVQTRIERRD